MTLRRRSSLTAAALLALVVTTTACGGSESGLPRPDAEPAALSPTSTTAEAAADTEPVDFLVVTGSTPATGPGGGGTRVVIVGAGFWEGVRVLFGGVDAVVLDVTENRLEIVTPPSVAPLPDVVDIVVVDPFLDEQVVLAGAFTYDAPADDDQPDDVDEAPLDDELVLDDLLDSGGDFFSTEDIDPLTTTTPDSSSGGTSSDDSSSTTTWDTGSSGVSSSPVDDADDALGLG